MPLDETVAADIYRDDAAVLAGSSRRAALDPARAEDVVQEVILRVWRQAPEVTSMREPCRPRAGAAEPDEHEHDDEPLGRIGQSVGGNLA
jgi:DNA-directed RNA polymerase specialized sigma24 family protein